jgi:hypothetical protein
MVRQLFAGICAAGQAYFSDRIDSSRISCLPLCLLADCAELL